MDVVEARGHGIPVASAFLLVVLEEGTDQARKTKVYNKEKYSQKEDLVQHTC